MRFPKEAIVFGVVKRNFAIPPAGEVVEFQGYSNGVLGLGTIECRAVDDRYNLQGAWLYHTTDLKPLTKLAAEVLEGAAQ